MSYQTASIFPQQTSDKCGLCKKKANASWFCEKCSYSLCDACVIPHKTTELYISHTVVPFTNSAIPVNRPNGKEEHCQFHPEKEISLYCNKCNVPCCISCLAKNHQRHEFSTIEDKFTDVERNLNEYKKQLDTEVRPTLDKLEKQASAEAKADEHRAQKIIGDIHDFSREFNETFDVACENLISQAEKISSENDNSLIEIENSKRKLESLKKDIEEKIKKGNLDLIKYAVPGLESFIPKSRNQNIMILSFIPSKKVLKITQESVKVIESESIGHAIEKSSHREKELNVQIFTSFHSKIRAKSLIKGGRNQAWVIPNGYSSNPSHFHLFNDMGNVIRSIKVDCWIKDMAMKRSGEIIGTSGSEVKHISMSGKVSVLIDTQPFDCYGICITEKDEIVVCLALRKNWTVENGHIAVFSSDGQRKLYEINCEGTRDRYGDLAYPEYVAQKGNYFYVFNSHREVVCFDKSGEMKWKYDGMPYFHWFSASNLCVDKYHNVLVADGCNNCVHYLDREGELIAIFLSQKETGFKYYSAMCVDDATGRIWLGNECGDFVIAKYSYE